jgi:hypothetical protein
MSVRYDTVALDTFAGGVRLVALDCDLGRDIPE